MRQHILMPRLHPAMTEAKITRWHVSEGQAVEAGDVLADVVTATATLEIEATHEGRVEKILVAEGTAGVAANTPIAVIAAGRESAPKPAAPPTPAPARRPPRAAPPSEPASTEESRPLTGREALREAMAEEMRRDAAVVAFFSRSVEGGGGRSIGQALREEFPARTVAVASPERSLIAAAMGAASAGLRPVVELTPGAAALESILSLLGTAVATRDLSGLAVPLVVRAPNGPSPGVPGPASRCWASHLAQIPGLTVVVPSSPADAKGLLKAAIRDPGPVVVLEHAALHDMEGNVPASANRMIPLGRANLAREGRGVTIVVYGHAVLAARDAADRLSRDGLDAEVIDLRSVRPLDTDTVLASVAKTRRLVTVEEGWPQCSIGAEVCAVVAERVLHTLAAPPRRLAGRDVLMPYAENLEADALPNAEHIAAAVRELLAIR